MRSTNAPRHAQRGETVTHGPRSMTDPLGLVRIMSVMAFLEDEPCHVNGAHRWG